MERFTQKAIKELKDEITRALCDIGKAHDVTFKIGNIHFDENTFDAQLQCFLSVPEESERMLFEKYCARYGLKPSDYERTFRIGDETYSLIGFDTKARKYNYVIKNITTHQVVRCTGSFKLLWSK